VTKGSGKNLLALWCKFMEETLSASVSVPCLFLAEYASMGLSDAEFIQFLRLLSLNEPEGLSTEAVSAAFGLKQNEAAAILNGFAKKSLLTPKGDGQYSFDGLYKEMFESWHFNNNCQFAKGKNKLSSPNSENNPDLGKLYTTFENEFARGLSPMEGEKITSWFREYPLPLIEEALRRAVFHHSPTFPYIEKILLSWKKKNLSTLDQVLEEDDYRDKNSKAAPRRRKKAYTERDNVYAYLDKYKYKDQG
jgi:DNA replication protein